MRRLYWSELSTVDFAALDPETTIAVLPVAAIEQHGPHLPVSTDTAIGEGMIGETLRRLPEDLSILILPTQAVGKSNEHLRSAGTLTLSAETALRAWTEIGESVHRAGLRKLVFANGHGGNVAALDLVALDLRTRLGMLAVPCSFSRFGYPDGLFGVEERAHGIHGGDIETSLMLAARPDLVRTKFAKNFVPASLAMAREFKHLRTGDPIGFGWMSQDRNSSGAIGVATPATAAKGEAALAHGARAFVELLDDVVRFDLARLADGPLA